MLNYLWDRLLPRGKLIERNEKHVNKIIALLKKADTLYLATDQDREGEAIAWHVYEILKEKDLLKDNLKMKIIKRKHPDCFIISSFDKKDIDDNVYGKMIEVEVRMDYAYEYLIK